MDDGYRARSMFFSGGLSEKHDRQALSLHDADVSYMFSKSIQDLSHLLPYLDSLTIDITRLYCTIGCCREKAFCYEFKDRFIRRLVDKILQSNIRSVKFSGFYNTYEMRTIYKKWGFEKSGAVNRDVLAKKWGIDISTLGKTSVTPTGNSDRLDNDEDDDLTPVHRHKCVLCSSIQASDEPSVSSQPEDSLADNAITEGAVEGTAPVPEVS